ncbi:hypothetical protein AAVH_20565 [Aphelenchoides avenae]|nr:hypothetical protein AAVH_20565 [Aphelenchus avenae]
MMIIIFGVYFQLFMYMAGVANKYTAIVHPVRHNLLFELGNNLYQGSRETKVPMILVPIFAVSPAVCLTGSVLQTKTLWAYHRLGVVKRNQLKEEFLLLGQTSLGS